MQEGLPEPLSTLPSGLVAAAVPVRSAGSDDAQEPVPAPVASAPTSDPAELTPAPSSPAATPVVAPTNGLDLGSVATSGSVDVGGPPLPTFLQQSGPVGAGLPVATDASAATAATGTVVAAGGPLPGHALPATGLPAVDLIGLAGVVVAAGILARVLGRPRRTRIA